MAGNCKQCGRRTKTNPKSGVPYSLCQKCFNKRKNKSQFKKPVFKKKPTLQDEFRKKIYLKRNTYGGVLTHETAGGIVRMRVDHFSTVHKFNEDGLRGKNMAPWEDSRRHALAIKHRDGTHNILYKNARRQEAAYRRILELFRQL